VRVSFPRSPEAVAFVCAITGHVAEVPAAQPVSAEVRAEEERRAMNERVHRALFAAARECAARGEILDVLVWEREVVLTEEL
jgi:hypothetical protein